MDRYKHIVYNPHLTSIEGIIKKLNDDTWQFVRSQPITEYEWVAIFEKWDSDPR